MHVHKPIAEIAGAAESLTITTSRVLSNAQYHLVFDFGGHMLRVMVKQTSPHPDRHALEIKFTKEDEQSPADAFAIYRDGTVYFILEDDMPSAGSTMNLTLKTRHEIEHAGRRKQANFASDYELKKYSTRVDHGVF